MLLHLISSEIARNQLFNFIKLSSYLKNLFLAILVGAVMNLSVVNAESKTEVVRIINALNSLMNEDGNKASLNLQPIIGGVAVQSVGKSAVDLTPTPFIIGGSAASRNSFRDYVLVIITDGTGEIAGLCGGTMIAANKVLTAGHCSEERASRYLVIPGFYAFSDQLRQSDLFPVSRVARHPKYNSSTFENDVAVLTLTQDYLTQISSVLSGTDRLTGDNAKVIGTGLTATNPPVAPNALQEVLAPITSNTICNTQWESLVGIKPIKSNMLCAGFTTDGRGSCSGDSGGPLFVEIDGQRVIVGTVSFGLGQCELNRATQVYARLTSMTDFIRSESPNTNFIDVNTVSLAPVINFLMDDAGDSSVPGGGGSGGQPPVSQPPLFRYPTLPARVGSGTDLVIAVVGNESDTLVGQDPLVFHLNSPQNGAQMVFQDIGLDEVSVLMQRPGSFSTYSFWIRTPQATFPFADLAVATYAPAVPILVFSDDTKPSIDFSHNNGSCQNSENGSFTIGRISNNGDPFASTGLFITSVEGYFEVSCSDDGGKIRGRFRYTR